MYTIGRLARRFGLSRSTLLYYDKIGLLKPSSHMHGAYRHYSESDRERLQRICMFRDAGLALADIARALHAPSNIPHSASHDEDSAKQTGMDTTLHTTRHPTAATLNSILEARMEELHREMIALRNQRTILAGLLKLDVLPPATPITKDVWTSLLSEAGFTEEDMRRWHADFEHTAPEQHARFLRMLGISEAEIRVIRA